MRASKLKNDPVHKMTTKQFLEIAKALDATETKEKEFRTVTLDMAHHAGQKEYKKLLNKGWQVSHSNKRGALEWKPGRTDFMFESETWTTE